MSEQTETVRGEIDGYITDLNQKRHDLCNFQQGRPEGSLLIDEAKVAIMAIDNVLEKLAEPSFSENVSLNEIVKLSTDVQSIKTSANRLLTKR